MDAFDVKLAELDAALQRLRKVPAGPATCGLASLGAAAEDGARAVMDVTAGHARRHAGAHDCADGRAGNRHRPDAKFVQGLDDMDMGEPFALRLRQTRRRMSGSSVALLRLLSAGPTISTAGSALSSLFATAFV